MIYINNYQFTQLIQKLKTLNTQINNLKQFIKKKIKKPTKTNIPNIKKHNKAKIKTMD